MIYDYKPTCDNCGCTFQVGDTIFVGEYVCLCFDCREAQTERCCYCGIEFVPYASDVIMCCDCEFGKIHHASKIDWAKEGF